MKKQVLAAAAALCLVLATPSHANLVFNGGFEQGNAPVVGDRTNFIFGWTTQGDVFTETSELDFRHSGLFAAQFAQPEGGSGRVAQTLATVAGQSYELSYWLQGYRGDNGTPNPPFPSGTFRVTAGDLVNEFRNTNVTNFISLPWRQFTFDFIAPSDATLLSFSNTGAGFSLDDVSVVEIAPIPEPASTALIGSGMLALLCLRFRKDYRALGTGLRDSSATAARPRSEMVDGSGSGAGAERTSQ